MIALEKSGSRHHLQSCFYSHFALLYSCICCTLLYMSSVFTSQEMRVNWTLSLSLLLVFSRLERHLTLWNPSGCGFAVYGHRDRTPAPRPAFVYRRAHIYIIPAILSFCGQPFDRWSDHGGFRTSWHVRKCVYFTNKSTVTNQRTFTIDSWQHIM